MDAAHDRLIGMLSRLKLTAIRDQLDSLVDEAGRRELTIREALALFCEREIARKDERRIEMSVGLARFPFVRDLASFDLPPSPRSTKARSGNSRRGASSPMAKPFCCWVLRAWARRIWRWRSGARPLRRATRCCSCRPDPCGSAGQGACRARGAADALREAQAADCRRTRLLAVRARRCAPVLPTGVAPL